MVTVHGPSCAVRIPLRVQILGSWRAAQRKSLLNHTKHKTSVTFPTEGTKAARTLQLWEFYAGFRVAQDFYGYSLSSWCKLIHTLS